MFCTDKSKDVIEYNPPYVQSDYMCNPGPTIISQCASFLFWTRA